MVDSAPFNLDSLTLTEIIRLQNQLSAVLARRFERPYALAFSDIVESMAYFARYGDEAGGRLQQQHFDLLTDAMSGTRTILPRPRRTLSAVETAADTMVASIKACAS
jgi:hypothetical protein